MPVGRLTALLAGAVLCARATADPDLWGHLTFGRDVLQARSITTIDPYSFTQDVPWINHEWLSEAVFAMAYRVSGVAGLILLKTAILSLALVLAWSALASIARTATRWWLFALLPFAIAPAATTFRPQLWTLLALAFLVRLLSGRSRLIWAVPLFAVWANLHGGWVVGVGIMSAWLAGRLLDGAAPRELVRPAVILLASVAATLVNPYGFGLWSLLAGTVRMTREITEWRPLWQQADPSHAVLWLTVAAVVATAVVTRWRQIRWASMVPAAGLGIAALWVDRLGPLFALASLPVWCDAWSERVATPHSHTIAAPAAPFWVVDAAALVATWVIVAGMAVRCLPASGSWVPDFQAGSAFNASAATGRVVLPFDWGQYAIWHWGPRMRVSMDGRRETVYSERTLKLQDAVADGRPEGVEYLLRERPEYVWLRRSAEPVRAALSGHDYRIDVETERSFIAVRGDRPRLSVSLPMSSCFP